MTEFTHDGKRWSEQRSPEQLLNAIFMDDHGVNGVMCHCCTSTDDEHHSDDCPIQRARRLHAKGHYIVLDRIYVEEVPTPADDWATRAAEAIHDCYVNANRGMTKRVIAAIIREHAPKVEKCEHAPIIRRTRPDANSVDVSVTCAKCGVRYVPVEEP